MAFEFLKKMLNKTDRTMAKALAGDNIAQKETGDFYYSLFLEGKTENESKAVYWYRTAYNNKNKDALKSLEYMSSKNSEAAMSAVMNIYMNGDLNGEGKNLSKAFRIMQDLSVKNTGRKLSENFIMSLQNLCGEIPSIDDAYRLARKITDDDKKGYAMLFRPMEQKLFIAASFNEYLRYTAEIERQMLRREGRNDEILTPETEGGWGYSEDEAIILKGQKGNTDIVSSHEMPIAQKALFRHALDLGLSNIRFEEEGHNLVKGRDNRQYDVLEFHVSGIPLFIMPNMRKHFEAAQKNDDKKALDVNMALYRIFLVVYHIRYWFLLG